MIAPSEQDLLDWAGSADDRQWHHLLLLVSVQLDHGAREPVGLARVAVRLAHQGRETRAGQLLRAVTSIEPIRWRKISHSVLPVSQSPESPVALSDEHSTELNQSDSTGPRSIRALACVGMMVVFGRWAEARRACSQLASTVSKRQIVDYLVARILRPQVIGLIDAGENSGEGGWRMLGSSASCPEHSLPAALDQHIEPIGDDRWQDGWRRRGRSIGPSRQSRWSDGAF